MHILWFCGKFCHAHILKTELAFHQQQQCFYREATCETCHQKYRPDQGDCSCKDNIYNNNNGNDYTICYRCGRYKDQCTCNSNNPYDINNPPGGGGGSSSSSDTQNPSPESQGNSISSMEIDPKKGKYHKIESLHFSMPTLKELAQQNEITILDNLPDAFRKQGGNPDCTARAIATAANIFYGDSVYYGYALQQAYLAVENSGSSLSRDGVLKDSTYLKVFKDYFVIQGYSPHKYSDQDVQNHINNGECIIASFWTGDYEYDTNQKKNVKIGHDITIFGYNKDFYYCTYGQEDALAVPKTAIEDYPIYVFKGIKFNDTK